MVIKEKNELHFPVVQVNDKMKQTESSDFIDKESLQHNAHQQLQHLATTMKEESKTKPQLVANTSGAAPSPPRHRQPLEGGWGWACVLGCAIVHFLSPGLVKSFGVVIVYIMEKFQCSSSQVSLHVQLIVLIL